MSDPLTGTMMNESFEQSQENLKWVGLGIVIVSAILSNLGVNIQKISHDREFLRPIELQREYYTRPLWILGMFLVFLASFGDFEALGFAPQALVASVGGGCTVLANAFFAHWWLQQHLSNWDILGTVLIICGIVLSTSANEPDDPLSLNDLENLFREPEFLTYAVLIGILLTCILIRISRLVNQPSESTTQNRNLLPYLCATAAGIFGSFSVLLAKCASELVWLTFQGKNQFVYFTTYLFVGGMIGSLLLQTDFLNRAIMAGDTLSVFPVFQCLWIGCSVVSGIVYYQKFSKFSLFEWISLPLALLLIIMGIYLLASHENSGEVEIKKRRRKSYCSETVKYGAILPTSPIDSQA